MDKVKIAMILVFLTAATASAQTVTCTASNPGYGLDSITTCTGPVAQPPPQLFHAVALDVKPGSTYQELEMQRLQLEAMRLRVEAMRAQQPQHDPSREKFSRLWGWQPINEQKEAQKNLKLEQKEAQKLIKAQQKEKQKQEKK